MIVPILDQTQAAMLLRSWAERIIHADGDRDEDAASNLTCEYTIAVAKLMLSSARLLDAAPDLSPLEEIGMT